DMVLQELAEVEPANVNVEAPPYHQSDYIRRKVRATYQRLIKQPDKEMMRLTGLEPWSMPII
ncbi:12282_t:CDS:1, partial [Ambispora leptoticha]